MEGSVAYSAPPAEPIGPRWTRDEMETLKAIHPPRLLTERYASHMDSRSLSAYGMLEWLAYIYLRNVPAPGPSHPDYLRFYTRDHEHKHLKPADCERTRDFTFARLTIRYLRLENASCPATGCKPGRHSSNCPFASLISEWDAALEPKRDTTYERLEEALVAQPAGQMSLF